MPPTRRGTTRSCCCRSTPTGPRVLSGRGSRSCAAWPRRARSPTPSAAPFGAGGRGGRCGVAIGCAGLLPLDDWTGRVDNEGRELRATQIAVADQAAAAADLTRAKDSHEPAVLGRGLDGHVSADDGPGAVAGLVRAPAEDLFL